MATVNLTAQTVRELLDYAPETGVLKWRVNRPPRGIAGSVAGCVMRNGYIAISFHGVRFYAHRLAWLHHTGEWPMNHIDHIDGNPLNNAIANLRDVSPKTNMQNLRRAMASSASGLMGASFDPKKGKWAACIKYLGKTLHLGRFDTAEEAHAVYIAAKRRLHAGCTI